MPGILPPQVDLLLGTAKTSLTPLPNYLGILVHTKTHKRALMNTLFNLGLCISYDQVLDLSTELGNKIYNHSVLFNSRVSCLLPSQSTISTTIPVLLVRVHDSFHGTGISLFQHSDDPFTGAQRQVATVPGDTQRRIAAQLLDTYTNVPPVTRLREFLPVPLCDKSDRQLLPQAMHMEYRYGKLSL